MPLVKLKSPRLSKKFVAIGVQFVNGKATFVLVNSTYWPPATPFVPMNTTFDPNRLEMRLNWVMTGCEFVTTINVPGPLLPKVVDHTSGAGNGGRF